MPVMPLEITDIMFTQGLC